MGVYNRKLFFNRGGQVNGRGTGITSGLAQHVQRFQTGGTVDPMAKARQVFNASLMSGKSKQPGNIGSILDILGQSMGTASQFMPDPKGADEYFWAYNTSTGRYERVTEATFNPEVHTKDAPAGDSKPTSWQEYALTDSTPTSDEYAAWLDRNKKDESKPTSYQEYALTDSTPTEDEYAAWLDRNEGGADTEPNSYKEYKRTTDTPTAAGYKIFLDRNESGADKPNSYKEYELTTTDPSPKGYDNWLKAKNKPVSWQEYALTTDSPTQDGYTKYLKGDDKTLWSNPTDVDALQIDSENKFTIPVKLTRSFKDGQFEYRDIDNNIIASGQFKLTPAPGTDTDQNWMEQDVLLQNKTDEKDVIKGLRTFDRESGTLKYLTTTGEKIDMANYNDITASGEAKEKAKETIGGSISIEGINGGEPFHADFIQRGTELLWLDTREGSGTNGQYIPVSSIDGLLKADPQEKKYIETPDDILARIDAEKDMDIKYDLAKTYIVAVQQEYDKNKKAVLDYQQLLNFVDQSTSGSYADQRLGLMRFLETFGFADIAPDLYEEFKEAIDGGQTPSTEIVLAMSKQGTLAKALGWNQQLNQSELGLLVDSGNQIYLTKEGQKLLALTNKRIAEIKAETYEVYLKSKANGDNSLKSEQKMVAFQREQYDEFLNDPAIKQAIEVVKSYENVGGKDFFSNIGEKQFTDEEVINMGEAYKDGRVVFGGFPDAETGNFTYLDGTTDQMANKSKPVYYVYREDGSYFAYQF